MMTNQIILFNNKCQIIRKRKLTKMTHHFNTKYQKIHSDCLELLNSKAIFMSGSELKEYLGYDIKRISQAIVVAQKNGTYDIINVKGKGYVSTKC